MANINQLDFELIERLPIKTTWSRRYRGITNFSLSPNKKYLLYTHTAINDNGYAHIFDLTTKQHIYL